MQIIKKPTDNIINLTGLIDDGITSFLEIANTLPIGRFESIVESRLLLNLCIRYLESINELAKLDLVYLPSALVLSRSVFEGSINVVWMLHPCDLFECESRYFSRLKKYEDWLDGQIKFSSSMNWETNDLIKHKEIIFSYRLKIEELLLDKGYKQINIPNIRNILKDLTEERKYNYYRFLSEYTHSGYNSTGLYRKNLGTCMEFGEYISVNDWKVVFAASWPIFELATELFIDRASMSKIEKIYSDSFKKEIYTSIENLN